MKMRVVALVSGGKDSCYNMLQCVAAGHEIVALANLRPKDKDELDSYMYQTVGHHAIELYAEAMDLPLYRRYIEGSSIQRGRDYTPIPNDEVEDLYELLKRVKEEVQIEAVSVGAVLSDYQRVRVENVCARLGLISLAYLWRRDQTELLQEMIDCNIQAIIIKVAAMGLTPNQHLGCSVAEMQPHLEKLKKKYSINVCGEGGEYETFTLDCPLFKQAIVVDESENVIHSDDAFAPVGYLNFKQMHLVNKDVDPSSSQLDRLQGLPVRSPLDFVINLDDSELPELDGQLNELSIESETVKSSEISVPMDTSECAMLTEETFEPSIPKIYTNSCGWSWISTISGIGEDSAVAVKAVFSQIHDLLLKHDLRFSDLVAVEMYVNNMKDYAQINTEYIRHFAAIPPVRVCVEVPLPWNVPLMLRTLIFRSPRDVSQSERQEKKTMHVQGMSHWAPANIGPYSQAVKVGPLIYLAGQIALVPGTMQLIQGGIRNECKLSLRHLDRIIKAIDQKTDLRDAVQGVCYVIHECFILEARREWESRTHNGIVCYIVVPHLPRGALVEWQIWVHSHNNNFEYEETGCCIGENIKVSIRRKWNYDSTVAAVVSHAFTIQGESQEVTDEDLTEIISYTLRKFLHEEASSKVCSIRIFYKVGVYSQNRIQNVCHKFDNLNLSISVIPVSSLGTHRTIISICGVVHEENPE